MRELHRTSEQLKELQTQIAALQKAELRLLLDQRDALALELQGVQRKIADLAGLMPPEIVKESPSAQSRAVEPRAVEPRRSRKQPGEEDLSPLLVQGRWPACVSFSA